MTTKTKTPTFPTATEIRDHIDSVIIPEPGRMREVQKLSAKATSLLAQQDPGDTLANLVHDMIHAGATPTPEELANAATDSQRHADIERAQSRLSSTQENMTYSRNMYPTGEQHEATLDYLSTVMDRFVKAARAFPKDTPLTADDVISYGNGGIDLYTGIQQLVATYTEIRRAQSKAYGGPSQERDQTGHFKDATNTEATWLSIRKARAQQDGPALQHSGTPEALAAHAYFEGTPTTPWGPISRGPYPQGVDTNEDKARFILWAANHTELWVPSRAELEQQHKVNTELMNLKAWLFPAERRNTSSADFDQARASLTNRETATA